MAGNITDAKNLKIANRMRKHQANLLTFLFEEGPLQTTWPRTIGFAGAAQWTAKLPDRHPRAFFAKPTVLAVDEETSALDMVTEQGFLSCLALTSCEKTMLTIAHLFGFLMECDEVILLEGGRNSSVGIYQAAMETSECLAASFKDATRGANPCRPSSNESNGAAHRKLEEVYEPGCNVTIALLDKKVKNGL